MVKTFVSRSIDDSVIVALGGNLAGDFASCETLLEAALDELSRAGLEVLARSGWWRSAAWPDPSGPEYRNGVAIVEAEQGARETLQTLRAIETRFGRTRGETNTARTLDLDLIAYGRTVMDEAGLILPHPRAHQRLFVMGPLAEIAPGWRHPVSGKLAAELAQSAVVGRDALPSGVFAARDRQGD